MDVGVSFFQGALFLVLLKAKQEDTHHFGGSNLKQGEHPFPLFGLHSRVVRSAFIGAAPEESDG